MKRSKLWLINWELKLWMEERVLLRLQKKSTSIRQEQLNYPGKCWQQFQNFQCSRVRLWNSNKKKKRKSRFSKRPSREWKEPFLQQILLKQSGPKKLEILKERSRIESRGFKESNWKCRCRQMVLRLPHSQDQTLTCLQISRFPDLTVVSNHSSQPSLVPICGTSSSQSQWKSITDTLKT